MKALVQKIIEKVIHTQAFINNYPKPGVVFLTLDSLFNDPVTRNTVSRAVVSAVKPATFDAVASIASRGYLFSGMIANELGNKGEYLVQKVKSKDDSHYVQVDTTTEYSSDALQVLKNTIKKGMIYLVTDDLIATGGSVMTAINLIRKCGGEVNTVLVMTELTDFNAREMLKQEGVELISILKFTNQDLQKMLQIQKCHAENPQTPITYQLTHHAKGVESFIAANHSKKLTVHLASQSPLKKEAAQAACQGLFDPLNVEMNAYDSLSGVNQQPFGDIETINGAANRIKSLTENNTIDEDAVLVSMENGIRYSETDQCHYDFVHVIVKKGEKTFTHTQDCCKIPAEVFNHIRKDENQHFLETWGETAQRMGLVKQSNDPHKEPLFGGISRVEHLTTALSHALGKLKVEMLKNYPEQTENEYFSIKRLLEFNSKKSKKYAKCGIFFSPPTATVASKSIDLYNQGCPVDKWNIDPAEKARSSFKVFTTGDAFAIISPKIDINGADVTIHVGIENTMYSPLVMIQEALQLCRCAYEQGAKSITVSLPDDLHPVAHYGDFNSLLVSLFKASGANKIYYYDKNLSSKPDVKKLDATMSLTLSNHSDNENDESSLDMQIMHFTRERHFKRTWSKMSTDKSNTMASIQPEHLTPHISIPENTAHSHVLLCCSANKPLAEKIAANLRERGETVKLYYVEGNGEKARIPENASIAGAVVTIVQSTRPNPDNQKEVSEYLVNGASSYLFEAAMIARQATLRGAKTVNLINPYQFSARSDKAEDNPKGKTGSYVQQNGLLLEAAGVNQVITAECHDNHTMSGTYTGKNIRGFALHALTIISTRLASEWISDSEHPLQGQIRLVMPDAGAAKRTKDLTESLKDVLGSKLCKTRVLGDKQRDSHEDISAIITSLNSSDININPKDRYLMTDDETATGTTLCQAITNLSQHGAKNISVIVAHNNMPLDWLMRQLCLARFFYLGVQDLHFSDTQEMGTLAKCYDDLIASYSLQMRLSQATVEEQVFAWFKSNLGNSFSDQSEINVNQAFCRFKALFQQFNANIRIHSLADEFASKVASPACVALTKQDKPASNYSTDSCITLFACDVRKIVTEPDQEVVLKQTINL